MASLSEISPVQRYFSQKLQIISPQCGANCVCTGSCEHVDGSVQPMVLCKKRGIDAHGGGGLTVSPAELPVPWQDCTFRQKSHLRSGIVLHRGAKIFTLLCREVSPGWHWLGRTVFGTIWQLPEKQSSEMWITEECWTLQVRVRPSLRRFAISSDEDGRSVLVQSMHNPLGIEADTSISVKWGKTLWQSFLSLLVIGSKDCLDQLLLVSFSLALSCLNS